MPGKGWGVVGNKIQRSVNSARAEGGLPVCTKTQPLLFPSVPRPGTLWALRDQPVLATKAVNELIKVVFSFFPLAASL